MTLIQRKLREIGAFAAALAVLAGSPVFAATDRAAESDTQRTDLMTKLNEMGTAASAFAEASPGDSDLGEQMLLTPPQKYRAFNLYAGANEYFTTDATLVEDGYGQDWFAVMQAGLSWTPRLWDNLYADFYARQELYRYARYSDLSFNATNLGAGLTYVIRPLGDLSIYGRYGFAYLGNAEASGRIYDEQFLKFGLQKAFSFGRAQVVYAGVNANIVLAGSPSSALRDQYYAYWTYQLSLTRKTSLSACYQIGYIPFRESSRKDWNQLACASVSYQATKWFSASALISGGFNGSTDSYYNYSVLNLGFGLNGSLQF